jgi:hypothetical protein
MEILTGSFLPNSTQLSSCALGQASPLPSLLVTVFHHTPVETKNGIKLQLEPQKHKTVKEEPCIFVMKETT